MQKSVLVKIFRKLSKSDRRGLRKFVRSPYFNKREDVVLLFDYLDEHIEKKGDWLDRRSVFPAIFPNEKFQMQQLRYVQTFLVAIIKDYLTYDYFRRDALAFQKTQLTALSEVQSKEDFTKTLEEMQGKVEGQPLRHLGYFEASRDWHRQQLAALVNQRKYDQQTMLNIVEANTAASILNALKLGIVRVTVEGFSVEKVDVPFLEQALDFAEQLPYSDLPAVAIYFHLYQSFSGENQDGHFQKLNKLLSEHIGIFPQREQGEILFSTINYCIKRYNRGGKEYMSEVLQLYRLGLENEAIMDNGYLSRYSYHNILLTAIHQKDFEWAFDFLAKYKERLPENEQEAAYTYNLAILHSYQKNYDEALTLFQKVTTIPDPLYNLDARRMLVKIFYEKGEIQALTSQLDNYRAYLRRHSEIGYHRNLHKHFLNMVQQMVKKNVKDKKVREKLRNKVEAKEAIAERAWLLEQLAG